MKEYKTILYELAQHYPKLFYKTFFKGKIRENCWYNILSIEENRISFGLETYEDRFHISCLDYNCFVLNVPKKWEENKEEYFTHFREFLITRQYNVFSFTLGYQLDQYKGESVLETIDPLSPVTSELYSWMSELNTTPFSLASDLSLHFNGMFGNHIRFSFNPLTATTELFLHQGTDTVYTIKNSNDLEKVKRTLLPVLEFNAAVSNCIKSELDFNHFPWTKDFRGYHFYGERYHPFPSFEFRSIDKLVYAVELGKKRCYFASLEEFDEQFLPLFRKYIKAIKLKSLFKEKEALN